MGVKQGCILRRAHYHGGIVEGMVREDPIDEPRDVNGQGGNSIRRSEWQRALGLRWPALLALYVAIVFVLAALMPLDDTDLPMHLAIGGWIAQHHAVPFTEPFAWTRPGAPYFAYSWLMQLGSYGLLSLLGPVGLHLLYAAIACAAVLAVAAMGRVEGWRPWPTLILAAIHFVVLTRVTPSLRPQVALYALVPLAWAATSRLRGESERSSRWPFLLLFAASALAANSHLLFALTGAPVFVLLVDPPARWRTALCAVLAVGAGWLFSPYALAWPEVFRLNFAPNPLFRYPSPIAEYQPGFSVSPVIGAFLALVPWFAVGSPPLDSVEAAPRVARRWLALAALWLVGLIAFSHVAKAMTIWWLVSLPLTGAALSRVPDPRSVARSRVRIAMLAAIGLLLCAEHALQGRSLRAREGDTRTRTLPGSWSIAAEPLAAWLQSHAHPQTRARLFTTFNYGSYLTWRLPMYSASIDSRTIFPDSVAAPEAYAVEALAHRDLGPWRSADVAIAPLNYAVAAALDSAPDWERLAQPESGRPSRRRLGLWARRAWWDSVAVDPRAR